MSKWYAYLHITCTIVVHPYRRPLDITSSWSSPYVLDVTQPYEANDREEAEAIAEKLLCKGDGDEDG